MQENRKNVAEVPEIKQDFSPDRDQDTPTELEELLKDEVADSPRIALTLQQAAAVLGKSQRALERSLTGKWGNKLPEGWDARKIRIEGNEVWRIIAPPGFKLKFSNELTDDANITSDRIWEKLSSNRSLEKTTRLLTRRLEHNTLDHHTIVIDRTDEVEYLLRELVSSQKALAEERRLHLEDLRLLNQMQGSMRLLEVNSQETTRLKVDLVEAQQELVILRKQYQEFINLPWWRRLFRRFP